MARRKNPYDVYADEPDVAPSVAAQRRLMHEAAMPLPPAAPAFYADVEEHGAVPLTHVTDAGREIGMARHGVDPADLGIVQNLSEYQEELLKLDIADSQNIEVPEDFVEQLKLDAEEDDAKLAELGYGKREIQRAQIKVWNRIKYVATKAAYRILGRRRDIDVDAVAAEGAVKAYMSIHTFHGTSKLSTWVYKIVSNIANSALRESNMHRAKTVPSGVTPLGGLGLGMTGVGGTHLERASIIGGGDDEGGVDVMAHPDFALSVVEDESAELEDRVYALERLGVAPEDIERLLEQEQAYDARVSAKGNALADAAQKAYNERVAQIREDQDAAITKVFNKLSHEHQQILSLRAGEHTIQLPDGTEAHGKLKDREIADILGIPLGTVGTRLKAAREQLKALSGIKPPYLGLLAMSYLGLKPQGRPLKKIFIVKAVRGSEADRAWREAERARADMEARALAEKQGRSAHVRELERAQKGARRYQVEESEVASIAPDVLEYLASRPRETVWRRARQNPMVGEYAYYETASDLLDLWLSGTITEEQYDEHLAALMAEEGVDL